MAQIRCKVSHVRNSNGKLECRLEWYEVEEGEVLSKRIFGERFELANENPQGAYVSRVAINDADIRPGSFSIDGDGKRHFFMDAETGKIKGEQGQVELQLAGQS